MFARNVASRAALITSILLTCTALAQQNAHSPADFAGTWQAKFQSKPFLTLTLKNENGTIGGTMSSGDINTDEQGNITSASARPGESPIVSSRINQDSRLELKVKEADSDEVITLILTLVDHNTASLRFVLPPDAGVVMKPLKLQKVETKS